MKTIITTILAITMLTGCASGPRSSETGPNSTPFRDAALIVGGAAGGGAIGNAIDPKYGALGAGAGGLLGWLINRGLSDKEQALWMEGYQEGLRQGQLKVRKLQRETQNDQETTVETDKIRYDANTVEGVRMLPRNANESGIEEKSR